MQGGSSSPAPLGRTAATDSGTPPEVASFPWPLAVTIVASYLFGTLGWHWAYLLPLFWLITLAMDRQQRRSWSVLKLEASTAAAATRKAESVTWINELLRAVWPMYEKPVAEWAIWKAQPYLDAYVPRALGVHAMRILHFSFGRVGDRRQRLAPIVFDNLRVVGKSIDTHPGKNPRLARIRYVFDADVHWHSGAEPSLELEAMLGPKFISIVSVTAKVHDVVGEGTMRLELDWIGPYPYLGTMHVSFLQAPSLDFKLSIAGSPDVMALAPRLQSYLHEQIEESIRESMMGANRPSIPLYDWYGDETGWSAAATAETLARGQQQYSQQPPYQPPPPPPPQPHAAAAVAAATTALGRAGAAPPRPVRRKSRSPRAARRVGQTLGRAAAAAAAAAAAGWATAPHRRRRCPCPSRRRGTACRRCRWVRAAVAARAVAVWPAAQRCQTPTAAAPQTAALPTAAPRRPTAPQGRRSKVPLVGRAGGGASHRSSTARRPRRRHTMPGVWTLRCRRSSPPRAPRPSTAPPPLPATAYAAPPRPMAVAVSVRRQDGRVATRDSAAGHSPRRHDQRALAAAAAAAADRPSCRSRSRMRSAASYRGRAVLRWTSTRWTACFRWPWTPTCRPRPVSPRRPPRRACAPPS